jgi:2-amino-4-hydroxy-6-hydroxymethyldihydropteridine diphosphokinase
MPLVALSLGSNINPSFNIRQAVVTLRANYPDLKLSPVYESEAVGFTGDNFLNLVATFATDESLDRLTERCRAVEDQQGRDRSAPKFSGRTLDIDILIYGELQGHHAGILLPRPEITSNAFVLRPLADLLPNGMHPALGRTFAQLWAEFDDNDQHLWPVDFDWEQQDHAVA